MMKINVYSEKSGNFGANSEKKPMIIIESRKRPLEPGQKDKNGKPILSLKSQWWYSCSVYRGFGGSLRLRHLARSEGFRGCRCGYNLLLEARYEEHEAHHTQVWPMSRTS